MIALRFAAVAAACAAATGAAGCASGTPARGAAALDWTRTRQFGTGRDFRPPARAAAVAGGRAVGALRCSNASVPSYGVHLELFAAERGILVPAGIGMAPPLRHDGALVSGGRCVYPLRTADPTGVVQVAADGSRHTVGELFALWGQPLSADRLGSFSAGPGRRVVAYVNGRRWPGSPQSVPLLRHAALVIEIGPYVAPHPSYTFAPGL